MLNLYVDNVIISSYNCQTSKSIQLTNIGIDYENHDNNNNVINYVLSKYKMTSYDIIQIDQSTIDYEKLRLKFIKPHFHTDDEIRYFTSGNAKFYIQYNHTVYEILVSQGDLISIPKNTVHWFDAGDIPDFTAIRFFSDQQGWIAHYIE